MKKLNNSSKSVILRMSGTIIVFALSFLLIRGAVFAQSNPASPANRLFPNGNPEGTRYQPVRSAEQNIDSFQVKWSSPHISGDVKPLIGNLINDGKLFSDFNWAGNEIAAIIGGKYVIIDSKGKAVMRGTPPNYVKRLSCLIDTSAESLRLSTGPLVMGLETVEYRNIDDTLGFAYVAGFDPVADSVGVVSRLTINLRDYDPNIFASVKPLYGRRQGGDFIIYATVNMSDPEAPDPFPVLPPYFRGFTQFIGEGFVRQYPFKDLGDDINTRFTLGPDVSFSQPSISLHGEDKIAAVLPCWPSPNIDVLIENDLTVTNTFADLPYLTGLDLSNRALQADFEPVDLDADLLIPPTNTRPRIRPYYLHLDDAASDDSIFVLVCEEYTGLDGSDGTARLHLYDSQGAKISSPGNAANPPIVGGQNHVWSVAVGNVDGAQALNDYPPLFPNNPGKEIIVTQSSREFLYAGSKLMILRYYSGASIEKPSPPNTFLNPLDTIVTHEINGWVAAVNDLDAEPDLKDEIVLVNGSNLKILRLRNYRDVNFRLGMPFDTLYSRDFNRQTISDVAIADIEGDGLNDLIVTTFDSLYVLGSPIVNTLDVFDPVEYFDPREEFCSGDSIFIKWKNIVKGDNFVNVKYRLYDAADNPLDSIITIELEVPNDLDTVVYAYEADSLVLGTRGKFIVESATQPDIIFDTTAVLVFGIPTITPDTLTNFEYFVGEEFLVEGTTLCVDSTALEFAFNTDSVWTRQVTEAVEPDGSFSVSAALPCAPYFNCIGFDADSLLLTRSIGFRGIYADTSDVVPILLRPLRFGVEWDTCTTDCPTRTFTWDPLEFDYACDTVSFSVSVDDGLSFVLIDRIAGFDGEYTWRIPRELPDTVVLRFCCEESCIRIDTALSPTQPEYLQIVSPNPFNPYYETLEIVYAVPRPTSVTIRIYDQNNKLVAEPLKDAPRRDGVNYCDRWDGRIWDGSPAANGIYYLRLDMSDGVTEVYPVFIAK